MKEIKHKTIQTEHLKLRRPYLTDADDIYACTSDREVCRYELWERQESPMEAFAFLNELICRYDDGECFDWIIEDKARKKAVGVINLHDFESSSAYIGYWLAKNSWNQGLATEAVGALVNNCFKKWDFESVYANCHPANIASIKVLEKCGFSFDRKMPTTKFGQKEKNVQTDCIYRYKISNTNFSS